MRPFGEGAGPHKVQEAVSVPRVLVAGGEGGAAARYRRCRGVRCIGLGATLAVLHITTVLPPIQHLYQA